MIFKIDDNKIGFNKYVITVRKYVLKDGEVDKSKYTDTVHYVDDAGAEELEVNFVPKHKLLEIVAKEELDTSEYAWMEGIELGEGDRMVQIEKIASYGSLEAYEASLEESTDAYMTDLDYRLSMIELGLTD